jgi:hypothetical protein
MVRTALKVFGGDVEAHLQHGPCRRSGSFLGFQESGLRTAIGPRRSTARAVGTR